MIKAQDILEALEQHTNVLLYGQPGTGKSHLMKEVQNLFEKKYSVSKGEQYFVDTHAERNAIVSEVNPGATSRWVTFHQGYSYEDFIIGLRPKIGATCETPGISLEPRVGALLELAARAKDGYGLMLIDEINRGNASRIFGEFITLMEADKRLQSNGSPSELTVSVSLPYIAQGASVLVAPGIEIEQEFRMPKRIYTLASMNSVDKSVAPLDAAIRRRFYVMHIRPNDMDLSVAAGAEKAKHSIAALAVKVMKKLNRGIGVYLGPDYMLGQFYLPVNPTLGEMNESGAKAKLVQLWRHKLVPQLIELFHSRPMVCENLLRVDGSMHNSGIEIVRATEEEADEGGASFIVNIAAEVPEEDLYRYLENFVLE